MSFTMHASHPHTEISPPSISSIPEYETPLSSPNESKDQKSDPKATQGTSVRHYRPMSHALVMHDTGEISDFH